MKKCWASCLGGCGNGFSGEHVISKGLFSGKCVEVTGSPWSQGKMKKIGLSSMTGNILCRRHNSQLSKVDQTGIRIFRGIKRIDKALENYQKSGSKEQIRIDVVGVLLERWFIKTAVNMFVVSSRGKQWANGEEPSQPPIDIVNAAFGISDLQHPRGLYNWAGQKLGSQIVVADQVGFVPIYHNHIFLSGAHFEFQGLGFTIWFSDAILPWTHLRDLYHHMGAIFKSGEMESKLAINWADKPGL